jgi:hypothetical protein
MELASTFDFALSEEGPRAARGAALLDGFDSGDGPIDADLAKIRSAK